MIEGEKHSCKVSSDLHTHAERETDRHTETKIKTINKC